MPSISSFKQRKRLALCLDAGEYQGVSLFAMKIYPYLLDPASEKEGFLRVVDEEGEPYYYDAKAFIKINARSNSLSIPLRRAQQPRRKRSSASTA